MDMTPYSNNGTRLGNTTLANMYTTDRNSQSNKAMSFDGSSDYVNIDGIVADVASDTAGTWTAWVKPDSGARGTTQQIMSFGDTNANTKIDFFQSGGVDFLYAGARETGTNQWRVLTSANPFSTNTWTHVALVQDGTSPVIYIDGVAVAQTFDFTTDKTYWNNNLSGLDTARIGNLNFDSGGEAQWFDGDIADVRIYNRALSAAEIQTLYEAY